MAGDDRNDLKDDDRARPAESESAAAGEPTKPAGYGRGLYWANALLACSLLAGILVIVNYLVANYGPLHWDWTSKGIFSLHGQTRSVLKALEKPVRLIAIYQRGIETQRQLEQIFELYEHESKMVSYEFIDAIQDKIRTEELFKKYPDAKSGEPVVIVTYGSGDNPEHRVVKDSDILKMTVSLERNFAMSPDATEFNGEAAITSAIIQLMDERKTNVLFTTGHGELDPNNSETRTEAALRGIGLMKDAMTALSMNVDVIDLMQKEIPSDTDLIVIAGPQTGFEASEVQKLRDFMDRRDKNGNKTGHLLVLLDPADDMRQGAPNDAGLSELLASFDVQVKDNLVVQIANVYRGSMAHPLISIGGDASHAVLNGLEGERVPLIAAREVSSAKPAPPGPGGGPTGPYQVTTLLSTLPSLGGELLSWAESDYKATSRPEPGGPDDTPGPVSVAVAVAEEEGPAPPPPNPFGPPPQRGKSTPRMIVFGDSGFATNYVTALISPADLDLFMNSVNWLRGRLELVDIPPRTAKHNPLDFDDKTYYRMVFGPTVIMFGVFVAIAASVWIVRHRF